MSTFDLLHPALQHHIVNSLGWRELRPFQEEVIPAVLRGEHVLVIAPTAGGKTEAAILPVLSRMLTEDWRGLSTLYICPIKALLNNLHPRLARYASLVGRTCGLWHGDVSPSVRARINRDPPDILLTTPESLEVMLVSQKTDCMGLLGQARVVIVDELHAFAGDDRGWHLLAVLQRISRLTGRELQRLGLSATVGNPHQLLQWLTCYGENASRVVRPEKAASKSAQVQLDYVGSLANAAVVVSRMHRGEKRLVFVDSRARAEELAAELRKLDVTTFVTHSSLSRERRTQTEQAFALETNCVIVATSVLELGVDVGDLDHIIQIDAPATTASFLQRMGRTGRRPGIDSNCLFLATNDYAVLQAAAIIDLWTSGYVEDVVGPPVPYHVMAQQLFALVLQEQDLTREDWHKWIGAVPKCAGIEDDCIEAIFRFALNAGLLCEDNGILHMGPAADRRLGRRNFMELLSVISSPPLFQVRYGRCELGFVHPLSFTADRQGPTILALGGCSWRVVSVDWDRRIAHVEPSGEKGHSRWSGSSIMLSPSLCAAIRNALGSVHEDPRWSRRACGRIGELRQELAQVISAGTVILQREGGCEWWTFAGLRTNQTIVSLLEPLICDGVRADNLWIKFSTGNRTCDLWKAIQGLRDTDTPFNPRVPEKASDFLKFADLLPPQLLRAVILARMMDWPGAHDVLGATMRIVES